MANRPRPLTSGAAAFLCGVALLAAVRQVPRSVRAAENRVHATSRLPRLQRELEPARFWGMNERLLLRAEQRIPKGATYWIDAGPREARTGVPLFYAYWLLPRRREKNPVGARWVIDDRGSRAEIVRVGP